MDGWKEVQGRRRSARRRPQDCLATQEPSPACSESILGVSASAAAPRESTLGIGADALSPLAADRARPYALEAGAFSGRYHDDGWEVVVDRTFIDVLPLAGDHPTSVRCRSAPADLGNYSLYKDSSPHADAEEVECVSMCETGTQTAEEPLFDTTATIQRLESLLQERDAQLAELQGRILAHDDVAGQVRGLHQLLQQRDTELERWRACSEKPAGDEAQMERLLRERDKEVRLLNQRLSAAEKTISKRDAEIKKRDVEISRQKELLDQRDTELMTRRQQLDEMKAATDTRIDTLPADGRIEVVARHALEETEIKVYVSKDATFRDVKATIAEHLGSDEIFKKGRLLRKHRGAYAAYSDDAAVGAVRSLLVLGISLKTTSSSSKAMSAGELQARLAELQADNSKKDVVLRRVLGELKLLREEKEAGFSCVACIASQKEVAQKEAALDEEAPFNLASTALAASEMCAPWSALLASKAALLEKEDCASCEPVTEPTSGVCSECLDCESVGAGTVLSAQASGCEPCAASLNGEICAESVGGESSSLVQGSGDDMTLDLLSEQGSSVADPGSSRVYTMSLGARLAAQRTKKVAARMAKTAAVDALAARIPAATAAQLNIAKSGAQPVQQNSVSSRMRPIRRQIPISSGIQPMWMLDGTCGLDPSNEGTG